jgi:hypothetical protein
LLIVNNWFVIADGFAIAVGTKWARLFFIAFYAICVLICLNVVVAFALDAFHENAETLNDAPQTATSAREDEAADDAQAGHGQSTSPETAGGETPMEGTRRSHFAVQRHSSRGGSMYFDASMITGTRTGLETEEWRATIPSSLPVQQQRSILRKLMWMQEQEQGEAAAGARANGAEQA